VRTNSQNINRYFTAVWSAYVLVGVALIFATITVDDPTLRIVVAAAMLIVSGVGCVIGFMHGITLFVAREHDARNAESTIDYLTED
jgi:hypothetical protein